MTTNLWLGNQHSYEAVLEAKANALAKYGDKEGEAPEPKLLNVQSNVGIIDIKGSLINGNAGWLSYFGVTGYGDIRDSLVAAIQNPEVSAILLNIDSGGGAVAGVHETAQLISRVDKIKPVIAYNGGTEASAALWLGSSARTAYAAETALTGSLGIIMVHAERSKQLEDDGIKVTVIRAGTEKALANPYEPLTDNAKAALEEKAQAMYDIFLGHVASMRGLSDSVADSKFGQGREFVGKAAVTAGLVDSVGTFEDAYTKAASLGSKIASKNQAKAAVNRPANLLKAENFGTLSASLPQVLEGQLEAVASMVDNTASTEGTSMPKPLTQEQLVAMAAGVTLEATVAETVNAEAVTETSNEGSTEAPTDKPAEAAAAAPSELVTYLQVQVTALQAESLEFRMAAKTAADALTAATTNLEALAGIARNSIRSMTIALGGKAEAVEAMSVGDVVAEHSRVAAVFTDKFKVGAVAATNTLEDKPVVKATVNPLFAYAAKSLSK
jgi:signal peptide peptidase SppA